MVALVGVLALLAGSAGEARASVCGDAVNHLDGTERSEDLDGTPDGDLIRGLAGDDEVHAGAGDDCVFGGVGDDVLFGEAGDDRLRGGPGRDRLVAGEGEHDLQGGVGDDVVIGGDDGIDYIFGDSGHDVLRGGPLQTVMNGGQGADEIGGGGGPDRLTANDGEVDRIACGTGRDRVVADRRERLSSCERVIYRFSAYAQVAPAAGAPSQAFRVRLATNSRVRPGYLDFDDYYRLEMAAPGRCEDRSMRTHSGYRVGEVIAFRLRPNRDGGWCPGRYEGRVDHVLEDQGGCRSGCVKTRPFGTFSFRVG
jgi:Ca2+-binding RTX toxin-like protein